MLYYITYNIERMNQMTEFCNCGSIMINGSCTNKNCSNKLAKTPTAKSRQPRKPSTAKTSISAPLKAEPKATKIKRASKCITHNLYDLDKSQEQS